MNITRGSSELKCDECGLVFDELIAIPGGIAVCYGCLYEQNRSKLGEDPGCAEVTEVPSDEDYELGGSRI